MAGKYDMPGPDDAAMVSRFRELLTGVLKAGTTDLAGGPVDLVNMALKAVGVPVSDKPVGGSRYLREKLGQNTEDASAIETIGTMVNPQGAAKAMIIAAARIPSRLNDYKKVRKTLNQSDTYAFAAEKTKNEKAFNETQVYADRSDSGLFDLKTFISDKEAYADAGQIANLRSGLPDAELQKLLVHPKLYDLYPELRTIPVRADLTPTRAGAMEPDNSKMYINPAALGSDPDDWKTVLIHETQHAIQHIEGFRRGGNTGQFLDFDPVSVQEKINRARKSGDVSQIQAADRYAKKFSAKLDEARNHYMNIPGEQEARYSQETRSFSEAALADDISALLRKGDTPQTYDTRPIRPISPTK